MLAYIARRILGLIPVLLGVAFLVFSMLWIAPGDPVVALLGDAAQGIGRDALAELRRSYGLGWPFRVLFGSYLGDVIRGDLGVSLRSSQTVLSEITSRFPATLALAGSAMLVAIVIGMLFGVL